MNTPRPNASQPHISAAALQSTITALLHNAGRNNRMRNAVERGLALIEGDHVSITGDDSITVNSPDSGKTYTVSLSECKEEGSETLCAAFAQGFPCKHRAALQILMLIHEEARKDHACAACSRHFEASELRPVNKATLAAGTVVPAGACPECNGNCYPVTNH